MTKLTDSLKKLFPEKEKSCANLNDAVMDADAGGYAHGWNDCVDDLSSRLSKAEVDVEKLAKELCYWFDPDINQWEKLSSIRKEYWIAKAKSVAKGIDIKPGEILN